MWSTARLCPSSYSFQGQMMNREQRKFALETLSAIMKKKEYRLQELREAAISALGTVEAKYAKVLAKDKAEQRLLIEARVEALSANRCYMSLNADGNESFVDTPKLRAIREEYRAARKGVNSDFDAKRAALEARVEELRRQIMLGDLPPQALALLTDFEAEEI